MAVRQDDLAWRHTRELGGARVYGWPDAPRRRATRRRMLARRRVTLSVMAGVIVVATLFAGGRSNSASLEARSSGTRVVVTPGDTLWDIATTHAPAGVDVRAYVDAIAEANGIGAELPPGSRIVLP